MFRMSVTANSGAANRVVKYVTATWLSPMTAQLHHIAVNGIPLGVRIIFNMVSLFSCPYVGYRSDTLRQTGIEPDHNSCDD